jgi:hypothetical protein
MSEVINNESVTSEDAEIELNSILDYYNMFKTTVESMEGDVLKADKGNKAASVRLRKTLRFLKGQSGNFVKFTLGK